MKRKKTFITELKNKHSVIIRTGSKENDIDYEEFPNRDISRLKDCVFPPMGFQSPQKLPNCHVDEKILMNSVLQKLRISRFPKMVNLLYSSKPVREFLLDSFWLFYFSVYSDIAENVLNLQYKKSLRKSKDEVEKNAETIFRRLSVNFTKFTLKMTTQYRSDLKDYFMSFLTEFASKSMYLFYLLCFPKEFLEFQSIVWKRKIVTFFNLRLYGLNNIMNRDRRLIIQDEDKWMGGYDVNLNLLLRRLTTKEELKKLQIAMKIRLIRLKKLCNYMSHNEFRWDSEIPEPEDFAMEEDREIARKQQEEDLIGPVNPSNSTTSLSSKTAVIAVKQMKASPSLSLVAEEEAKWNLFVRKVFPKKHHVKKLERRLDDLDRRIILTDEPIDDQEAFLKEVYQRHGKGGMTSRNLTSRTSRASARTIIYKGGPGGPVGYQTTGPAPRISHVLRAKEPRKLRERHHSSHVNPNNPIVTQPNEPQYFLPSREKKWFEAGTGKNENMFSKRCNYTSVEKDRKFQAFSKTESPFIRNYLRHLHEEQQRERIRKIFNERQKTLYSANNLSRFEDFRSSSPVQKTKKTQPMKLKRKRRPKSATSFFHGSRSVVPNLLDSEKLFTRRPKTTAALLTINKRKRVEENSKKRKKDRKNRKEKTRAIVPPIAILKKRNRYRLDDVM